MPGLTPPSSSDAAALYVPFLMLLKQHTVEREYSCTLACQKTMVIFSVPSYIVESLEGSIYIEMKMPGAARQRSERVLSAVRALVTFHHSRDLKKVDLENLGHRPFPHTIINLGRVESTSRDMTEGLPTWRKTILVFLIGKFAFRTAWLNDRTDVDTVMIGYKSSPGTEPITLAELESLFEVMLQRYPITEMSSASIYSFFGMSERLIPAVWC
ncbi:hypothetical protein BC827DRAFT_1157382 [Russula dissimulans]|nr:hypothetical protein BC827DRAFT_1157382 [Russula dissimulans]